MLKQILIAIMLTSFTCVTVSADENDEDEVLRRFVGSWKISGIAKPSKWSPEGGEIAAQESAVWALKKRLVLIREVDEANKRKALWITTYDAKQKAYPFWGFDSKGLAGAEWRQTWDASINKMTGKATDLQPGWTSAGQNHFTDADTNVLDHWIKNDNGELMLHHVAKKERLPAKSEAAIAAAWLKNVPADDRPAELKVLERMIGTWDDVSIQKPAVWTQKSGRVTAKITRQWILDGRLIMDRSILSDGTENLALFGFDPQSKVYGLWWFNSEGHHNVATGSWNDKSQTISYVTKLDDGKTWRSSLRFANRNHEVWDFKVTDADGKVYFDMDSIVTRRSAADTQLNPGSRQPKPTDQSRLQGTWGATQYVQNGQGKDEAPIAPEDSAIRFMFKGKEFLLLASGNAGESPKGTYKLGSSGKDKTIDLTLPSGAKKQTMSGIYKFDGETLKITFAPDGVRRPNDFKSAVGSKLTAIVFKRIKE